MKLYVFDIEGQHVATISGEGNPECEATFAEMYDANDFVATYSPAFGFGGAVESDDAELINASRLKHKFLDQDGSFYFYEVEAGGETHKVTLTFDDDGGFDVSCVDGVDGGGLLAMPIVHDLYAYFKEVLT
jgi:hypothetical protein